MSVLIVENAVIESMAYNNGLLAEFPTIKNAMAQRVQAACGSCGSPASRDYMAVKRAIVGLSPNDKERLKQLLAVSQIRVFYRVNGMVTSDNF